MLRVGRVASVGAGPARRLAGRRCRAITRTKREHDGRTVIKEEQMPDGRRKLILKDEATGAFSDVVV